MDAGDDGFSFGKVPAEWRAVGSTLDIRRHRIDHPRPCGSRARRRLLSTVVPQGDDALDTQEWDGLSQLASLPHLITCPLDRLLGLGVRLSGLVLGSLHLLGDVGLDRGDVIGSDLLRPDALRGHVLVSLSLSVSHHVGDFAFAFIPRCVDLLVAIGFDLRGGLCSLLASSASARGPAPRARGRSRAASTRCSRVSAPSANGLTSATAEAA